MLGVGIIVQAVGLFSFALLWSGVFHLLAARQTLQYIAEISAFAIRQDLWLWDDLFLSLSLGVQVSRSQPYFKLSSWRRNKEFFQTIFTNEAQKKIHFPVSLFRLVFALLPHTEHSWISSCHLCSFLCLSPPLFSVVYFYFSLRYWSFLCFMAVTIQGV